MISCLVKNAILSTSVCKYAVLIKVFDLENPSLHNVNVSPTYMNSVSSIVFIFFFLPSSNLSLRPKTSSVFKVSTYRKKNLYLSIAESKKTLKFNQVGLEDKGLDPCMHVVYLKRSGPKARFPSQFAQTPNSKSPHANWYSTRHCTRSN